MLCIAAAGSGVNWGRVCASHHGSCCSPAMSAATAAHRVDSHPPVRVHTLSHHPPAPPLPYLQANRAHTYLGKREAEWHDTQNEADIYPDFPLMAKSFGVPGAQQRIAHAYCLYAKFNLTVNSHRRRLKKHRKCSCCLSAGAVACMPTARLHYAVLAHMGLLFA